MESPLCILIVRVRTYFPFTKVGIEYKGITDDVFV